MTIRTKAARRLPLAIALACLLAFAPAAPSQHEEHPHGVGDQVAHMLEELQGILGFGAQRRVEFESISKSAFRKLYQDRMRSETKPDELRREALFLKLFGFVPDDFDYEATVLDLMSEQAWALYDFKRRNLYLADWAPDEALEFAMVHELVHAIDDQNFNLRRYMKSAKDSEAQLARLAAMEGQASWVMTEWALRQAERSLEDNRLAAIATASATRFEAEQFPVFASSPLYFREVMIFPYTDGLLFQHELIERFGQDGFEHVFVQPPTNTQQILQPDLYLEGFDPDPPRLESVKIPKGFRKIYDGTFGQLDHRILIEQHLGDEDFASLLDSWRGGQFEVSENRRTGRAMLRYASRWEDPEDAREYYHLYRQICERKWDDLELVDSGEGRCEGVSRNGRLTIALDGSVVRSVEGLPVVED